jgi:hypothetical protein
MFIRIDDDKVGIVKRNFGRHDPREKSTVRIYGSPGIQADVLRPGQQYFRSGLQFSVTQVPRTRIPSGTIGVVVAKAGANAPSSQRFGRPVDCDYFQDGVKFLRDGGQMGRQAMVLGEGTYNINPEIFEVLTIKTIGAGEHDLTADDLSEIEIKAGEVGVVVTRDGSGALDEKSLGPKVAGHGNFQDAVAFLAAGGYRGVQEETLSRGTYLVNPWFARVIVIPTRTLVLDWSSKKDKPADNYDVDLEEIPVNIEGFNLLCTMSQTVKIPASSAPKIVHDFGEIDSSVEIVRDRAPVQRFVDKVLGKAVDGFFQTTANKFSIDAFVENKGSVRAALEVEIRDALKDWDVDAPSTTVHEFKAQDSDLDAIRQKIARERIRLRELNHRQVNSQVENQMELDKIKVERERRRLENVAEIEMLNTKLKILGRNELAMTMFLELIAPMNVPQVLAGDANGLLQYMPLQLAMSTIGRAMNAVGASDEPAVIEDGTNAAPPPPVVSD